jgi:hypothetical protein
MISKVVGDRALMDCAALFMHFQQTIAMQTIRARCTVVAVDDETGIQLYDFAEAEPILSRIRSRRPHRRRRKGEAA